MSKPLDALREALFATGLVQPLESKATAKKVAVLCRLTPGQERAWLRVVESLLKTFDNRPDTEIILARRYVMRNGRMAFGWYIVFETKNAKELKALIPEAVTILQAAKPDLNPVVEEEERPAPTPKKLLRYKSPYANDPDVAAALAAAGSTAAPRAPSMEGEDDEPRPPPGLKVKLTTVENTIDSKGKRKIVQEMPLPNVYQELNKPTKPEWSETHGRYIGGGRGAKSVG